MEFVDEYGARYKATRRAGYICMFSGNHDTSPRLAKGRTRRGPESGLHLPADHAGRAQDLLRRRDRHGGRPGPAVERRRLHAHRGAHPHAVGPCAECRVLQRPCRSALPAGRNQPGQPLRLRPGGRSRLAAQHPARSWPSCAATTRRWATAAITRWSMPSRAAIRLPSCARATARKSWWSLNPASRSVEVDLPADALPAGLGTPGVLWGVADGLTRTPTGWKIALPGVSSGVYQI